MARTYRKIPKQAWLRNPKTGRLKRQTGLINDAIEDARAFDVELSGKKYANPCNIIDAWHDIHIAGLDENWK